MSTPEELANFPLGSAAEAADSLPKTELNPLINPVLGQNLGRWAQVYFTTPPEKREEAVEQLLRELKSGSASVAVETHRPAERTALEPMSKIRPQMFCPACQRVNEGDQRFCGFCGGPLSAEDRDSQADMPIAGRSITSDPSADDEMEWLRDKTLAGFEQLPGRRRRGLRYLFIGILILLTAFGYLQWASRTQSRGSLQAGAAASSASSLPRQTADSSSPRKLDQAAPVPDSSSSSANASLETRFGTGADSASQQPTAARTVAITRTVTSNGDQTGPDELGAAQKLLEGRNGIRNSSQAAQLLWKAVGKQNPGAALMLAELYARGDGVPKNCDQARLLLVAAAKKGVPQAGMRLRSLEANGCQ